MSISTLHKGEEEDDDDDDDDDDDNYYYYYYYYYCNKLSRICGNLARDEKCWKNKSFEVSVSPIPVIGGA